MTAMRPRNASATHGQIFGWDKSVADFRAGEGKETVSSNLTAAAYNILRLVGFGRSQYGCAR